MWMTRIAMKEITTLNPRRRNPMYVSCGQRTLSWSRSKKSACCCRTVWCECFFAQAFSVVPLGCVAVGAMFARATPGMELRKVIGAIIFGSTYLVVGVGNACCGSMVDALRWLVLRGWTLQSFHRHLPFRCLHLFRLRRVLRLPCFLYPCL